MKIFAITKSKNANDQQLDSSGLKWAYSQLFIICILLILLFTTFIIIVPVYIWQSYYHVDAGKCSYNGKQGVCVLDSYCCNGSYIIGADFCSGQAFCCLGDSYACNNEISLNETDLWSFPSITEISSKVMCMNTSQPIVEQAIVHSVSAVKEYVDYSSICEYITQELNLAAEQQWFCIAGDADSFEPYLQQFPSFISIFIKHINIFIFRTSFMSSEAADEENSLGVDRLPSVQIIYSQLNDSVIDFVRETSNFELSRCSFDYYCASANIRQQLNQYYGNEYGTKWQCIIIAADSSFAINVDQINSTFLELIFAKTHRIIVYKI